eukprot:359616-Chlamydomonas_euryale.AAC.7
MGQALHPFTLHASVPGPSRSAGIDSRGAMELRASLATSLGLPLPATLLYDHQSIAEIAGYVGGELEAAEKAAAATVGAEADAETGDALQGGAAAATAATAVQQAGEGPSQLLKLLRPAPPTRPLFLAAPGVANAQSAYFAFSAFLQVRRRRGGRGEDGGALWQQPTVRPSAHPCVLGGGIYRACAPQRFKVCGANTWHLHALHAASSKMHPNVEARLPLRIAVCP